MSHELSIFGKLKNAMITSCDDVLYFSDNETQLLDAEYLLTVNSAKSIRELNRHFGTPYNIFLENDTKKFATSCTPLLGRENADNFLGYRHVIRNSNNTLRSGKIDIAVYTNKNGDDIPICAIEVKGFNPNKSLIIADLERNSEYFRLTSRTGASILPFAFFISLHSYKGVWNDKKEKSNILKLENRYKKYINDSENLKNLHQSVEAFTIRRGVIPDANDPYIQEHGLRGDEDYQFVGVVITTKQPQACQSIATQQKCADV